MVNNRLYTRGRRIINSIISQSKVKKETTMAKASISRKTLREQVAEVLRKKILNEEIKPGERMYCKNNDLCRNAGSLSDSFDVRRTCG